VAATAGQIRDLLGSLGRAAAVPLFVFDGGYDPIALADELAGENAQLLVRIKGDRVFYADPPLRVPGSRGRPRRHGARFGCKDPATRPAPAAELTARRVLRICYRDRGGNLTERDVEPVVFMAGPSGWYLAGWCRVRDAARCFRVDRIRRAELTGVAAPPRVFEEIAPCIPDLVARTPAL
jgi:hypothetical protein